MSKSSFEVIRSEGYQTFKPSGSLDADAVRGMEQECEKQLFTEPYCHVVVNCENLSELSQPGIRFLLNIQRKAKNLNKQICLILANPQILSSLQQQGVSEALPCKANLRAALVDFGLVTQKALDVNFINPFLTATMNVLKIQASTESKPGKLYKRESQDKYLGDISGIIGLVSDAFTGSVVISFPEATFLKIMSRMLGEEFKTMSKEIEDGAGELTNIIFGQSKVILNEKGYGIKTAIPSVVSGKDHSVQNITNGPRVAIPFTTDAGEFFIEICISG